MPFWLARSCVPPAADGASVVAANKEARKPEKTIDGDDDSFMKNPCSATKWMVIELSQVGVSHLHGSPSRLSCCLCTCCQLETGSTWGLILVTRSIIGFRLIIVLIITPCFH